MILQSGSRPALLRSSSEDGTLNDLASFCAEGSKWEQTKIRLDNGISLQVTTFRPAGNSPYPPVIFVPGLGSVMENFRYLLRDATRDFTVYLIETKEKRSAVSGVGKNFSIPALASDLPAVVQIILEKNEPYTMIGFSMGATVLLEAFSRLARKPLCMMLCSASAVFRFPRWTLFLARFAAPFYPVIKPFLQWYLKHFRINTPDDKEMQQIMTRVLNATDPYKLCATIRAIAPYEVWEKLPAVDVPVLIITASRDTFHNADDTARIASLLPASVIKDLETNQRTHSGEAVKEWRGFLQEHRVHSFR